MVAAAEGAVVAIKVHAVVIEVVVGGEEDGVIVAIVKVVVLVAVVVVIKVVVVEIVEVEVVIEGNDQKLIPSIDIVLRLG